MLKTIAICDQDLRKRFVDDIHNCNYEYAVVKNLKMAKSIKQKISKSIKLLLIRFQ